MIDDRKNKKRVEYEEKLDVPKAVSFDVYFHSLMREKLGIILPHHKAPMRRYAADAGFLEATKYDFDRLFKLY
jgi:hypothetical protein